MSDNRKSFTPRDMLTSGGNGDIGCATPFGYVTVRYQGGEIVSVTVDGDRFVPRSGQGAEPVTEADAPAYLWDKNIRHGWAIGMNSRPQPAQQGSVPAGWKLVPVEPDEYMLNAGMKAFCGGGRVFQAMVEAAPQPPVEQADEAERAGGEK